MTNDAKITGGTLVDHSAKVMELQREVEWCRWDIGSLKRQVDTATEIINRQQGCEQALMVSEQALMVSEQELLEVEAAGIILRLKWLFTGINK